MKADHRHQLKQNDFALRVAKATEVMATNRDRIVMGTVAVIAIVIAISVYSWWSGRAAGQAEALLAVAMQTYDAPIVPAPTVPGATQQAGTYPTEQARSEAALAAFQNVINQYPSTDAATAARYHHAASLAAVGRFAEAEKGYQATIDAAGDSLFAATARLGQAEVLIAAKEFDRGLKALEDLAANRDGLLPVDGVLMQLARGYQKAGKTAEARTAFKRVVDEFPDSLFVPQARTELAKLG
jgi:tetratricopeptide (TPR) repeat protein